MGLRIITGGSIDGKVNLRRDGEVIPCLVVQEGLAYRQGNDIKVVIPEPKRVYPSGLVRRGSTERAYIAVGRTEAVPSGSDKYDALDAKLKKVQL